MLFEEDSLFYLNYDGKANLQNEFIFFIFHVSWEDIM
jgi:hypothetical protein